MKKFVKNTLGLKVLTPDGYKHFDGIAHMGDKPLYRATFGNRSEIDVTDNHRLVTDEGVMPVSSIRNGQWVYTSKGSRTRLKSLIDTGRTEPVYDLIGVGDDAVYYTNGILSHNCEFVTDDETLINPLVLARLKNLDPSFYTGKVRWWKKPESNKSYLVGLDPSLGTGRDYSTIQIFELPGMIQIGEWQHNHSPPRAQVRILLQILMFIAATMEEDGGQMAEPDIFWTVENNTLGEAILTIIEDTGEDRFPGMFVHEKKRKGQARGRVRKGLNTDHRKKLAGCARLKSLVESDRMILRSRNLITEFKNFVATENSFKAKPGEHDDLIMAALLCVRMLEQVTHWTDNNDGLSEGIDDDDLYGAMPVVV